MKPWDAWVSMVSVWITVSDMVDVLRSSGSLNVGDLWRFWISRKMSLMPLNDVLCYIVLEYTYSSSSSGEVWVVVVFGWGK